MHTLSLTVSPLGEEDSFGFSSPPNTFALYSHSSSTYLQVYIRFPLSLRRSVLISVSDEGLTPQAATGGLNGEVD